MAWHILFLFAVFAIVARYSYNRRRAPLPPGPAADPVIGHLRFIPSTGQAMYFYKLGLKYGDIMYFKVLGKSIVVLNSVKAANELLEKRGANYSDRPDFPIPELWGICDFLAFMRSGPEFRIQRKMIQQYFTKIKVKDFRPIETREARTLAQNLLANPDDRLNILTRFATAIIMDIVYGYRIASSDDPFIQIAGECGLTVTEAGAPGATPIDLFPILRHFPSWFPGTYYATLARKHYPTWLNFRQYPFDQVMQQMKEGKASPSFLASHLEALQSEGISDDASLKRVQAASANLYLGGSETTSSSLSFFLLAMMLYPQCQDKARAEIDAVVGCSRLPEFEDRENLPYLECLMQETLRWYNVAPTGLPHKSTDEDLYNGMLIPKGSIVIPNIRAMTLDEAIYKDASAFDPTRFLPLPAGRGEPHSTAFGFGRRICPGRHMAVDALWIAMATILATTLITKADKGGEDVILDLVPEMDGFTSHPKPYLCRIVPRSEAALGLLRHANEHDDISMANMKNSSNAS